MSSKFVFDVEYQWEIIKFIILDPKGSQALRLVEDGYFAILYHQVIIYGLKKFYKTHGRVPKNRANFKGEIKSLFKTKRYAQSLKEEDRKEILRLVDRVFKSTIRDGDIIFENCRKFATFIQVKKVVEEFDITDYNSYDAASSKLQRAIITGVEVGQERGEFLFQNMAHRHFDRKHNNDTISTPYHQVNALTNNDGFNKHSLGVIIDKGKGGKTAHLVNVGRGYLKQRKKIIVFDLENGAIGYATRYEQSLIKANKREVMAGTHDDKLQKLARRYKRMGSECVIKRLPAGSTTKDMEKVLSELKAMGLVFEVCIIDYIGIMGATSGKNDDKDRISDAYLDVKNMAERWDFDIIWTGHHITREAYKRRSSKYEPTDTAKCIDINRHIDFMFGVNQNEEEEAAGVCRWEVVDIRDGMSNARAYFWVDINTQRVDEFTKTQLAEYLKIKQTSTNPNKAKSHKGSNADI